MSPYLVICVQEQFIEKNNDSLHASLEAIVFDSKNPLVMKLYEEQAKNLNKQSKGKLTFVSVGSKFRTQLSTLMEKLRSTVSVALVYFNIYSNRVIQFL
jgi:myosin-6